MGKKYQSIIIIQFALIRRYERKVEIESHEKIIITPKCLELIKRKPYYFEDFKIVYEKLRSEAKKIRKENLYDFQKIKLSYQPF